MQEADPEVRIELRDFGVFEIRERAPRIAQNPKTLERVPVPPKRTVKFKVGRVKEHWVKNCLAVGLSQGFIEPLEATALDMVQETVARFVQSVNKGNFTDQYRDEFNDRISGRFDAVRDYIVCHYRINTRTDTDYWRDCGSNEKISPSLRQILAWGVDAIAATLKTKTDEIAAMAREMGLETAPNAMRAPHLIGLRLTAAPPRDLPSRLAEDGVYVSVRGSAIRVAPHVYNTAADSDRLFQALRRHLT